MKLFLKDHLSIIVLYLVTFLFLPPLINYLDGFANHFVYFVFLALFLLISFLAIRYFRRRKMYHHIETQEMDKEHLLLHQPSASIEKLYAEKFSSVYSFLLAEEDKHQDFLKEQQFLVSHAVHQMKTPVSVLQLLVESNQTKENNSITSWSAVKKESAKINFSLNQLLSYSRSMKLSSDLKIEPIPLKESTHEVINELKDYFIEEEVYPKVNISEDDIIYSDRKWFKVVLYQVLNNAIKYSDKSARVYITFADKELTISNQGESIPRQDINRIFNLFYTGTKGRNKSEATGIGLYLVKKILTTLNHSYKMTSSDNQTTFSISFK